MCYINDGWDRKPLAWIFLSSCAALAIGCGGPGDGADVAALSKYHEQVADTASQESAHSSTRFAALQSNDDPPTPPALNRRIVYASRLTLIVQDYRHFEQELPLLVDRCGGFVASSETSRRVRNEQAGTWVIRVPAESYRGFLQSVTGLGFAESHSEQADDITEQYVDLEARIRNKRTLEERIATMLQRQTGKLSETLEIERELSRVREEIERMQGRLRLLADRTALATITIQCREVKEYAPAEAPTFLSRIGDSWSRSLVSVRRIAETLVVGLVAVVPWLLALFVPVVLAARFGRRRFSFAARH